MSHPTWFYCIMFLASVPLLPQQENNQMCQPRCIEHITEVQSDRFHPDFNFTWLQRGSLAPQLQSRGRHEKLRFNRPFWQWIVRFWDFKSQDRSDSASSPSWSSWAQLPFKKGSSKYLELGHPTRMADLNWPIPMSWIPHQATEARPSSWSNSRAAACAAATAWR